MEWKCWKCYLKLKIRSNYFDDDNNKLWNYFRKRRKRKCSQDILLHKANFCCNTNSNSTFSLWPLSFYLIASFLHTSVLQDNFPYAVFSTAEFRYTVWLLQNMGIHLHPVWYLPSKSIRHCQLISSVYFEPE